MGGAWILLLMPYGEAPGKSSHWVAIGNGGSQQRDPIDEDFLLQLSLLAKSRYGAAKTMLTGFSSAVGWCITCTRSCRQVRLLRADEQGARQWAPQPHPTRASARATTFGTADDNYDDDGTDGSIDAASTFASYLARIPGASHTRHREAGTATTAITLAYTGAALMEYARVHPMPHRVPKDKLGDPWDGVYQAIRFGREAAGIRYL